jgi:hypothetical protein
LPKQHQTLINNKKSKKKETTPQEWRALLWLGIFCFPFIFSWFTLKKGNGLLIRIIAFYWLINFMIAAALSLSINTKSDTSPDIVNKKVDSASKSNISQNPSKNFSSLNIETVDYLNGFATVSGHTDLPEGSGITVGIEVLDLPKDHEWVGVSDIVTIKSGIFRAKLKTPNYRPEFINGELVAEAFFTPVNQINSVSEEVGKKGENLVGDLVKTEIDGKGGVEIGTKYLRGTKKINLNLSLDVYPMVNPSLYDSDSPEEALALFLKGWKDKDWQGASQSCKNSQKLS